MRFQVPQFIEAETKLIGPFTLRQFLFIGGGVMMSVMEFLLLSTFFAIVAMIVTVTFFGALAFAKVDGQPFLNYLAYAIAYGLGAKRYEYKAPPTTPHA